MVSQFLTASAGPAHLTLDPALTPSGVRSLRPKTVLRKLPAAGLSPDVAGRRWHHRAGAGHFRCHSGIPLQPVRCLADLLRHCGRSQIQEAAHA
jgi:hypothetical protein